MTHDATLVLLNYNELEGLTALHDRLPFDQIEEVFAVDPGSTDGSVEFMKKKGITVIHQSIRGRGEAFRIGVREAKYPHVIFFSPDGNEDPADIVKLARALEEGYDMAIASRFMNESRADDANELIKHRSFGNQMFTSFANLLFGGHLTDSINGFRAVKRDKFLALKPDAHGFGIEFQLSIRAMKLKHRIKEIPTAEGDRIGGKSTAYTFSTGWYFVKLLWNEWLLGTRF